MGAAALVVVGVVGLARLTVPDEPSFGEALDEAGEDGEIGTDFVPDVVGGRLTVTGAREATLDLEPKGNGPNFGLGSSKTQLYLQGGPLEITQMDHDGLSFFPDPDDCVFTIGERNEVAGLVAVMVSCPELTDIRGNGTLAVEGHLALPADIAIAVELPQTGGTVTVGETTWQIFDPILFVGDHPVVVAGDDDAGLWLTEEDHLHGLFLEHVAETDTLRLDKVSLEGVVHEVGPASCVVEDEEIMVANPQARLMELTLSCEGVEVPGLGPVPIEGTVVYTKVYGMDG